MVVREKVKEKRVASQHCLRGFPSSVSFALSHGSATSPTATHAAAATEIVCEAPSLCSSLVFEVVFFAKGGNDFAFSCPAARNRHFVRVVSHMLQRPRGDVANQG